jgi:NO-binding membrane sensor protein with MHYT domain
LPPPVLLGLTIATLYGCASHALLGRRLWQWPLFWISALIGFFSGYAGGVALGIDWVRIGSLPLLASTAGAVLAVWLCWFFTAPYADAVSVDQPE